MGMGKALGTELSGNCDVPIRPWSITKVTFPTSAGGLRFIHGYHDQPQEHVSLPAVRNDRGPLPVREVLLPVPVPDGCPLGSGRSLLLPALPRSLRVLEITPAWGQPPAGCPGAELLSAPGHSFRRTAVQAHPAPALTVAYFQQLLTARTTTPSRSRWCSRRCRRSRWCRTAHPWWCAAVRPLETPRLSHRSCAAG